MILLPPSIKEGVPKAQEHYHCYQNLRDHHLLNLQLAILQKLYDFYDSLGKNTLKVDSTVSEQSSQTDDIPTHYFTIKTGTLWLLSILGLIQT